MGTFSVSFKDYSIVIDELSSDELKPKYTDDSSIGFGKLFTDRLFLQEFRDGAWQPARIKKFEPFSLHPASAVFHYGQEIFEGMKAYYHGPGRIALFRPMENALRFKRSAERMAMQPVDPEFFVFAVKQLVKAEQAWIPKSKGTSFYIRPTLIATEPSLGVHPSTEYYFFIILSPSGPYFTSGFNPIDIFVESRFIRAAPGGTGAAKAGGNYAASLIASAEAKKHGCSQVLWLDALEHEFVEEVGAMNIMFVMDDTIVTPSLTGTILPGITRKSILELAPTLGYAVEERRLSIHEIIDGIKTGRVTEAFGCGTAAVITPIGSLFYDDARHVINEGKVGSITQALYDELTGIQYGEKPDTFHWMEFVE